MIENLLGKSLNTETCLPSSKQLVKHSIAVAHLANYYADKILLPKESVVFDDEKYRGNIINDITIAAALHDIGKCNSNIQEFFKKPTNKSGYYIDETQCLEPIPDNNDSVSHSILSFVYLKHATTLVKRTHLLNAILFHHPISYLNEDKNTENIFNEIQDTDIKIYHEFFNHITNFLFETYQIENVNIDEKNDEKGEEISSFRLYDHSNNLKGGIQKFNREAQNMITRTCVLCADRLISSLSSEESFERAYNNDISFFDEVFKSKLINTNVRRDVELSNSNIDLKRFETQLKVLNDINGIQHVNFFGSAGFGKTLFGTKWGIDLEKKLMWVTPTNTIARNVYIEIKEDLIKLGQTDVTVSLLLSGRYEEGEAGEHADIIVTNIDNFLSVVHKNNVCDKMLNLYGCNVVFDEYHEFVNSTPMFAAFLRTLYTRVNFTDCRTLLLSASPLPIQKYVDLGDGRIQFYNDTPILHGDTVINVSCIEKSRVEDIELEYKDSFYFFNSVAQTQRLKAKYGDDDDVNILHARYTKERRTQIENSLFNVHGKKSVIENRNTWFGTSLIGTSVNISGKHLYDSPITPEDTIQHQGRGARFGEKEYGNEINYTFIKFKNEQGTRFLLSEIYTKELNEKWFNKVKEYDGKQTTRSHFYTLFFDFYKENQDEYDTLLQNMYTKSVKLLHEIKLGKSISKKKDDKKVVLNNGLGLRGVNTTIYVVAKYDNDTLSDPIIFDKMYLTEQDSDTSATKARKNFIKEHSKDVNGKFFFNKHQMKRKDLSLNTLTKFALDEKTPLLLCNAVYDDVLGLQIIKNSDSICDIDD